VFKNRVTVDGTEQLENTPRAGCWYASNFFLFAYQPASHIIIKIRNVLLHGGLILIAIASIERKAEYVGTRAFEFLSLWEYG
jgi:hypothetical protein